MGAHVPGDGSRLFGRDREREILRGALQTVRDGAGSTLSVVGEAGIGKTAMLDALANDADRAGFVVARSRSEAIEQGRPFGAVRQLIESGLRGPESDDIETVLDARRVVPGAGWIESPETRFHAVDLFVEAIEREVARQPVVLLVDDAQWADDSSLLALHALRSGLNEVPLMLVIGTRPGNHPPGLAGLIAAVPTHHALTLSALAPDEVTALASDTLGREPDQALSEQLDRADGNPFFVHALLDAHQTGEAGGRTVPRSVEAAVVEQLNRLDAREQRLLRLAAVVGRPVSISVLAALDRQPVILTAERVETAVRARLLVDREGDVGFRHDLVREAVLSEIPNAVLRALHLAVGRGLLERSWSPAEVAEHFVAGAETGDIDAAETLRSAAAELERVAPAEARRLLDRAVEILPDDHSDYLAACAELAQAAVFSADLDRGMQLSEELLARALPEQTELGLRNALSHVFFLSGRSREAARELEQMATLVAGQPRESVVLADAAVSSMFAIDLSQARDLASRSLDAASRTADRVGPVLAHCVHGWLDALGGNLDSGLAHTEDAIRIADAGDGLEGHRRIPHLFHAQALLWADRVDEARESLARGRRLSVRLGMGWDEPMYHALAADERLRAGEIDDALAEIEAGLARAAEVGSHFADGWLHAHHARAALDQGNLEEAGAALDRGDAALEGRGGQGADLLWWYRALLGARTGDRRGALESLRGLWAALDSLGTQLRQAEMGPDVVRLATDLDDDRVTKEVLSSLEQEPIASTLVGQASLAWCKGIARSDRAVLQRARELLDQRGAPAEAARYRLDLAESDTDLTTVDPAVSTHESMSGDQPWHELTRSERRVVELVAQGLTNSAIAEELSVSRRTVESHLYRAYPKLGVSTRVELALLAVEHLEESPSV